MNMVRNTDDRAAVGLPPGVSVVDGSEALSTFRGPGCAAAIWRRVPSPEFQSWVDRVTPDRLPSGRVVVPPGDVGAVASQICSISETPDGRERDMLVADVADLADMFADLTRAAFLRIRFDVIATNACKKFHVDAVTARLVCTYRGTGSQYGVSVGGADPARVHTTPTGSPILLRGTYWPERPRSGLVHRSPPIAGTGETRLVLVLDPLDAMEEEY